MGEMRDLFVEHSNAGEEAVREAKQKAQPRFTFASGILHNATDDAVLAMLRLHYEGADIMLRRNEASETFRVTHRCPLCQKLHGVNIEERSLAAQSGWYGSAEYLLDRIDELLASPCPNMRLGHG